MHRAHSCIDVIIPGSFFNFFFAMRRRGPQVSTRWGGGRSVSSEKEGQGRGKSFGSSSITFCAWCIAIKFAFMVHTSLAWKWRSRLARFKLKGSGGRREVAFAQALVCCHPGPLPRSRSLTSCRCPAFRTSRCLRTWTSARSTMDCWIATMIFRFWPTRGWVCEETCRRSARRWEQRHVHCMRSRVRLKEIIYLASCSLL